jgi:cyanophycin synthetase
MQILSVQPLRGPNLWSISTPLLIQVKLDFTAEHNISNQALHTMFDVAKEHFSFLVSNDILEVTEQLTQATIKMAVYLQNQAGFKLNYTALKPTIKHGVYNAVYQYQDEKIGVDKIARLY